MVSQLLIFYAIIGGAPLAMAYKMINTLDSMIGHKSERCFQFGKFAARLNDGSNFLPARLVVPVIFLAAHLMGRSGSLPFVTALSEGANHSSPNAGYPEAAFAGALAVRLNGPGHYGGIRVEKPFIGNRFGQVTEGNILGACDLMLLSSVL
jgi:adenosylcobinamide-phosphate synthase